MARSSSRWSWVSTDPQVGGFPHGGTPSWICATHTKLRITQQGVRLVTAFQPDPTSLTLVVLLERELDPYFRRGSDLLRMQVLLQPIEGVDLEPHESHALSIPSSTSLRAHVCAIPRMAGSERERPRAVPSIVPIHVDCETTVLRRGWPRSELGFHG